MLGPKNEGGHGNQYTTAFDSATGGQQQATLQQYGQNPTPQQYGNQGGEQSFNQNNGPQGNGFDTDEIPF